LTTDEESERGNSQSMQSTESVLKKKKITDFTQVQQKLEENEFTFKKLTVDELKLYCQRHNITVPSGTLKAGIVALCEAQFLITASSQYIAPK
jgi:hypothetical protein